MGFDFNKLKKAGEDLIGKIKESGVVDKLAAGVKEGVDAVSTRLRSAMPAEVKDKYSGLDAAIHAIVQKKLAGNEAIDGDINEAEKHFQELIEACRNIKKLEQPAKPAAPTPPPAKPTTPPEAPKVAKTPTTPPPAEQKQPKPPVDEPPAK